MGLNMEFEGGRNKTYCSDNALPEYRLNKVLLDIRF